MSCKGIFAIIVLLWFKASLSIGGQNLLEYWIVGFWIGVKFNQISIIDNELFMAKFGVEEVREAVWSCGSSKCQGPDSFNFNFIKSFWETIQGDVLRFLDEFHRYGVFPKGCNSSFITLIPKVEVANKLGDYRSISLVECMYKSVAKVLSFRLMKVSSGMVDKIQSAFLSGRSLLHSVLVANEVVEEAERSGKNCLLFKVDFEKAYDSVSWSFLFYM